MKSERFMLVLAFVFAVTFPYMASAGFSLYTGQGSVYDSSVDRERIVTISLEIDHFLNSFNGGQWNEYNVLNWSIAIQDLMTVSGNGGFLGFAIEAGPNPIYSQHWMFQPHPVTASNLTVWGFAGTYEFLNTTDYFHLPSRIILGGVFDGDNGLYAVNPPFYLNCVPTAPIGLRLTGTK